jgi:hypothetical protein
MGLVTFDLGEGKELGGRVARGIGRGRNQGPYFNLLHLLGISRDYPALFSAGIHDATDSSLRSECRNYMGD